MKKSDLRTGMIVTLRNGETYHVLLHTGFGGRQEDVLVHKVGTDTGWMPLCQYDDDMKFHDDYDDAIFPGDPEDDPYWDIMQVQAVREAAYVLTSRHFKTIWERKEE